MILVDVGSFPSFLSHTEMSSSIAHRNEFIERLVFERKADLLPTMKLKLLNINATAKCLGAKYSGPVLAEDSEIFSVPLEHSKNKNVLVTGLLDALKSLFSSSNLIRTHHDTRMGFVIGKYDWLPVGTDSDVD